MIAAIAKLGAGLLAVGAVAAFVATPAAIAECQNDVPDNSEVDQYQETIPSTCGDQGTDTLTENGGGVPSGAGSDNGGSSPELAPAVSSELDAMGDDGRAVAGLVAATGGAETGSGGTRGDGPGEEPAGAATEEGSASLLTALVEGVGGSEGGLGLVGILIAVSALLGVGTVTWRLIHR